LTLHREWLLVYSTESEAGAKLQIFSNSCTMKVVELVKISSEALKLMSQNDVMRDDWRFVPMYEEFHMMRTNGLKYRECIRLLSEDYHVSPATIERAIRRLDSDC
jgi:hypothetical protein